MTFLPCHLPVSGRCEPGRLEIWSDGTLPLDLRPGDLTREHPSKPRNLDVTNGFYRRGLIEQRGRGTYRIVELGDPPDTSPGSVDDPVGDPVERLLWSLQSAEKSPDRIRNALQKYRLTEQGRAWLAARKANRE